VARDRLDFRDVSIEAAPWGASEGVFRVHSMRSLAIAAHRPLPLLGRYLFHEGFVTAGVDLGGADVESADRAQSAAPAQSAQ
jgi:hypothetical protein